MCFVQFFKILNFWVVMGIKEQKTVQNDKQFCPSRFISQEPYIIWLSFMVHLHKMISPGLFSFYQNFEFLGCSGGKRAKNGPKWQKIMSVALHIWGTVHHMTVIYVCKMMISLGVFSYLFIFFQFWFSGSIGYPKGHKMVQNDKKLCLLHSISQKQYIIWLSFMVQMCKLTISPGVFFNAKILIFKFVKGLKGQKNGRKCQKFLSVALYVSGTIYHMILIYGTHVCIKQ